MNKLTAFLGTSCLALALAGPALASGAGIDDTELKLAYRGSLEDGDNTKADLTGKLGFHLGQARGQLDIGTSYAGSDDENAMSATLHYNVPSKLPIGLFIGATDRDDITTTHYGIEAMFIDGPARFEGWIGGIEGDLIEGTAFGLASMMDISDKWGMGTTISAIKPKKGPIITDTAVGGNLSLLAEYRVNEKSKIYGGIGVNSFNNETESFATIGFKFGLGGKTLWGDRGLNPLYLNF